MNTDKLHNLARTLLGLTAAAALTAAVVDASRKAWLCDDAFISFRYARQLVSGNGLVFNVGERVEGYTNFLWTMLLAGGMTQGIAPERLSVALGLACYATLGLLLITASVHIARTRGRPWPLWPTALGTWLAIDHGRLFATSGLETSLYTLLVCATLLRAATARGTLHWAAVGLLGALATLTRPDGALVLAVAMGSALLVRPLSVRAVLAGGLTASALILPWAAWKLSYYGDLFPNTYHAKGGGQAWWTQGLAYLWMFFRTYWVALIALLAPIAVLIQPAPDDAARARRRTALTLGVWATLYLVYVSRVGGDFMFGRFIIPVLPVTLIGLELALSGIPRATIRVPIAIAASAALFWRPFPDYPGKLDALKSDGVVEEHLWYPTETIDIGRVCGTRIREMTRGLDVGMAIFGGQAMVAWYSGVALVVEGHTGLTDRTIAAQPVTDRRRIGHEKLASLAYLRERGVDLVFECPIGLPPAARQRLVPGRHAFAELSPDARGYLITYDPALIATLRERGARIPSFESTLDAYIASMSTRTDAQISADYAEFVSFYFRWADDPIRQGYFTRRLGR